MTRKRAPGGGRKATGQGQVISFRINGASRDALRKKADNLGLTASAFAQQVLIQQAVKDFPDFSFISVDRNN